MEYYSTYILPIIPLLGIILSLLGLSILFFKKIFNVLIKRHNLREDLYREALKRLDDESSITRGRAALKLQNRVSENGDLVNWQLMAVVRGLSQELDSWRRLKLECERQRSSVLYRIIEFVFN